MTKPPSTLRLVLIIPGKGLAVYEGRKCLAAGHGNFELSEVYVEEARIADYSPLKVIAS
jgi:hypothetical protein